MCSGVPRLVPMAGFKLAQTRAEGSHVPCIFHHEIVRRQVHGAATLDSHVEIAAQHKKHQAQAFDTMALAPKPSEIDRCLGVADYVRATGTTRRAIAAGGG